MLNHNHDEEPDFEQIAWAAIKGESIELRADALLTLGNNKFIEDEEPLEALTLGQAVQHHLPHN